MNVRWMVLIPILALAGCAEVHRKDNRFTASGYSFNVLFVQIPKDPMILATQKVPPEAAVTNVNDTPSDWRTLPGFLNRFFGVGWAQIGGTTSTK